VDEAAVGMAVLVHHSTPDPLELANGVATLRFERNGAERYLEGSLVTQVGATSVSNPDNSALPEVVNVSEFGNTQPYLEVRDRSSLVPLGGSVLLWPKEYESLFRLLDAGARQWQQELPARSRWILDFEYKKVAPNGDLRIKQIRPLPVPSQELPTTSWVLNTTNRWGLQQGEFGDVMAFHRLKSYWTFETRHSALAPSNLISTLFHRLDAQLLEGSNVVSLVSVMTNLPGYRYEFLTNATADSWETPSGTRTLQVHLERYAPPDAGPVAILDDLRLQFTARYTEPQPTLEVIFPSGITNRTTREETVYLEPVTPVSAESILQERRWTRGSREIQTTFYWPPYPKGAVAGYTAPVQAWVETTLSGIVSRPITLRSDFAQTYHPGHHNFWEDFLFDPWLEPGLEADLRAELAAANIRAVIVSWNREELLALTAWGLDGTFRELR
jgi:hypothetical protein